MTLRVQMLGLMRFSYVGLRGYQVEHSTYDQRREFLYDINRLARRWFWFETVALPAWLAQSDPDFTLVIMTGPDLPEPYMQRLKDLERRIDQLKLALVPPMERHLQACLFAIQPHLDPNADVVGHFRHDDDDAVAIDFIARARADFEDASGVWIRHRKLCLDYMRSMMVRVKGDIVQVEPRMCYNMGVAQTIFLPSDVAKTALHFEHWKVGLWMPGIQIGEPLMFLRLMHGDSDSGDAGQGYAWHAEHGDFRKMLRNRFHVDLSLLERGARLFA